MNTGRFQCRERGKFVTGKVDVPTRYQLLIDLSPDKVESYEKDYGIRCVLDNVDISMKSFIDSHFPTLATKGNVTYGFPVNFSIIKKSLNLIEPGIGVG
ncbi:MAG: hypothetical protein ACLU4N_08100 [Butyricimonas faecihominis]